MAQKPSASSLVDLPLGVEAVVLEVKERGGFGLRLRALGFRPGAYVEVINKAALGGPWAIRVNERVVALRLKDVPVIRVAKKEGLS
mgnify:FL=1